MSLSHKMAERHEQDFSYWFNGRKTPGSGSRFNNPSDVRQNRYCDQFAFATDCKSTRGGSISVSRAMWVKATEQAGAERPMLGLRFYDSDRLDVGHDLVVLSVHDLLELLEAVG